VKSHSPGHPSMSEHFGDQAKDSWYSSP